LLKPFPGVGLMEIITEPDFRSADEAAAFVKELQLILLTIGSCDCKMEGDALFFLKFSVFFRF
jgi:aspartyl-tRNA(Asn)/glutamyl-tRNA(Gln) amidotransferase subunit B